MARRQKPIEPEETEVEISNREAVAAELERIRSVNPNNVLLPQDVVAAASKAKTSPLGRLFEWDVSAAAHQHRLNQARTVIRMVRIEIRTVQRVISCPFYVKNPDAPKRRAGYVTIESIEKKSDAALKAVNEEMARASSAIQRARDIGGALDLHEEIEILLEAVMAVQTRIKEMRRAA